MLDHPLDCMVTRLHVWSPIGVFCHPFWYLFAHLGVWSSMACCLWAMVAVSSPFLCFAPLQVLSLWPSLARWCCQLGGRSHIWVIGCPFGCMIASYWTTVDYDLLDLSWCFAPLPLLKLLAVAFIGVMVLPFGRRVTNGDWSPVWCCVACVL